jgi:hypothetical protein
LRCQKLLGVPIKEETEESPKETWQDLLTRVTGIDPRVCPFCGEGKMIEREILPVRYAEQTGWPNMRVALHENGSVGGTYFNPKLSRKGEGMSFPPEKRLTLAMTRVRDQALTQNDSHIVARILFNCQ